mgnify:CR=1 FL=1
MPQLISLFVLYSVVLLSFPGCSPSQRLAAVDRSAREHIAAQQQAGLGEQQPFSVTPAADQLRRRLLVEQQLPVAGPASFSSAELEPVAHWPALLLPKEKIPKQPATPLPGPVTAEIRLSLDQALQVAARNSREYQEQKEQLYRSALQLDYQRQDFAWQSSGSAEARYQQDRGSAAGTTEGTALSLVGGLARTLTNGISLTTQLGWDLVRMLAPAGISSSGLYGDASLTVPLLRGSGRHIVAEPLTQAERDVLYAVWQFERFKQTFVVDLASRYLAALQSADLLRNQAENYRSLIVASRRARRLAEAGKLPLIQVDQAQQNELRARDRWVAARQARVRSLDEIRNLLGLPPDAQVVLERTELQRLAAQIDQRLPNIFTSQAGQRNVPADAPVSLEPPDPAEAGPLEIGSAQAVRLALANRLDLRISQEQVTDAQRRVVVAADALRAELTLLGSAATGSGRSIAPNQPADSNRLDFDRGTYSALLTLDLPFDRRREAIGLRTAYLDLEAAVRSGQELEDRIKLQVRSDLRALEQARASLKVQDQAVRLAERRVRGTQLELQAGRSEIRDLLDAREDLLSARNALTAARVDYRLAELELQRDLGVLEVDNNGLWQEFSGELQDERG